MRHKHRWLLLIGILSAIVLGVFLYSREQVSKARRALPPEAGDVKEYETKTSLNGTFCQILKARLPEPLLKQYAESLGMQEKYSSNTTGYLGITFRLGRAPAWWDPPASKEGAYFKSLSEPGKKNEYELLGYKDGYVYYFHAKWPFVSPKPPSRPSG